MYRTMRILTGCLLILMLFLASPLASMADEPNLLQNPGFEAPFAASIPGKENCLIAVPWSAWYVEGSQEQTSQGYLLAPEYKMATLQDYPGNRVHGGWLSQQYFHSFGNFQAGVYQVVNNVTPGSYLRFTIWAMTWSCNNESKGNCGGATSGDPSPMHLRIGIDPDGGTNPFAEEIVWSEEVNAYDAWQQLSVEAAAKSSSVTVFVYSYPDYRSQDNNVYLDDASLVVVAPPATNTPVPTETPLASPTPEATATHIPTNTPKPTLTPQPTATPAATATNRPTATSLPSTATAAPTEVVKANATSVPTLAATATATNSPAEQKPTAIPTAQPGEQSFWQKLSNISGILVLGVAVLLAIIVLVISLNKRRNRRSYR